MDNNRISSTFTGVASSGEDQSRQNLPQYQQQTFMGRFISHSHSPQQPEALDRLPVSSESSLEHRTFADFVVSTSSTVSSTFSSTVQPSSSFLIDDSRNPVIAIGTGNQTRSSGDSASTAVGHSTTAVGSVYPFFEAGNTRQQLTQQMDDPLFNVYPFEDPFKTLADYQPAFEDVSELGLYSDSGLGDFSNVEALVGESLLLEEPLDLQGQLVSLIYDPTQQQPDSPIQPPELAITSTVLHPLQKMCEIISQIEQREDSYYDKLRSLLTSETVSSFRHQEIFACPQQVSIPESIPAESMPASLPQAAPAQVPPQFTLDLRNMRATAAPTLTPPTGRRLRKKALGPQTYVNDHMIIRTNSKDKPFKCGYQGCNKAYKGISHVRAHFLHHTGVSPHMCPYPKCRSKRYFRGATDLKRHIENVHLLHKKT